MGVSYDKGAVPDRAKVNQCLHFIYFTSKLWQLLISYYKFLQARSIKKPSKLYQPYSFGTLLQSILYESMIKLSFAASSM